MRLVQVVAVGFHLKRELRSRNKNLEQVEVTALIQPSSTLLKGTLGPVDAPALKRAICQLFGGPVGLGFTRPATRANAHCARR